MSEEKKLNNLSNEEVDGKTIKGGNANMLPPDPHAGPQPGEDEPIEPGPNPGPELPNDVLPHEVDGGLRPPEPPRL